MQRIETEDLPEHHDALLGATGVSKSERVPTIRHVRIEVSGTSKGGQRVKAPMPPVKDPGQLRMCLGKRRVDRDGTLRQGESLVARGGALKFIGKLRLIVGDEPRAIVGIGKCCKSRRVAGIKPHGLFEGAPRTQKALAV